MYSREGINLDQLQIPPHVPRDLLSDVDRSLYRDNVIWIRTWFGDKYEVASQDAADEAYKHLARRALYDDDGKIKSELDNFRIYDNKEECSADAWNRKDSAEHFKDGVALAKPGTVPPYLVTAVMHYPDQFDADLMKEAEIKELDEDPCAMQLLLLVADRIACEQGWVLQLAINHRGQVLPYRLRDIARDTMYCEGHWSDGFGDHDEEDWYCSRPGCSGWD